MKPKLLKNDAEYQAARSHVGRLKGLAASPDTESELELWSFLIAQYERQASPQAAPGAGGSEHKDLWPHPGPLLSGRTWIFFFAAAAALYLRLLYQTTYFPPFFEGEESKVLDLARDTVDFAAYTHSWWDAFKGGLIEYNKGYHWLLVPFYMAFGYDVRIIIYVIPVVYSLLCGAFFTLYRKAYPKSSLLSFVVAIMFSVLCLALRRYKWHTVAFIMAIAVYIYFLPLFYKGALFLHDRWRKALAVFLFALSLYLYFGCLLYVAPFSLLVVFFSTKLQRQRELVFGCAGLVLGSILFTILYRVSYWKVRVGEELRSISQDFSHDGMIKVWGSLRDFFFTMDLSVPYLVIFVVGIAASFRKIRAGDKFALINTTLFGCIWLFQMAIGGLNNPDQTNWLMIPLLGVLLIGSDQILCALRDRVRYGRVIGAVLVLCVGWNEVRRFPTLCSDTPFQSFAHDRNTRAQIALVLRMIRDDNSGTFQYYLPAPSVSEQKGGFEYTASLGRIDYAKAFQRSVYFMDEEDLRTKLRAQKGGRRAVVYLSVGFPGPGEKDTQENTLLGQKPQIVHPYEKVYDIPYLVRRYEFGTGPDAPAAAPGA